MLTMNELKLGQVINLNNEPYQIVSRQHIKVARGSAVLKTKLKNLITGSSLEKTFSGADNIEEADIIRRRASFLYQEKDKFFFMDKENFSQFQLNSKTLGSLVKYLKDGQETDVLIFNDNPVAIALPKKIVLEVSSAPEGVRGNSSGAVTKVVVLETGLEIKTPLFIKKGDQVRINTERGEYLERI